MSTTLRRGASAGTQAIGDGMHLDLAALQQVAAELGFTVEVRSGELVVVVTVDARLVFSNLPDDDVALGFHGMSWHAHPPFTFLVEHGFVEYDAATLLDGLAHGELLVVELHAPGGVIDRWLHDHRSVLETDHLVAGEELRVRPADVLRAR
jgi:hypothetical protein